MRSINVFIIYSEQDKLLKDELLKHLELLKKSGEIRIWDESQLRPGDKISSRIKEKLYEADLILVLVSSDLIASKKDNIQLKMSLDRADKDEVILIPILLRPCLWHGSKVGEYKSLPKNNIPVTSGHWSTRDEAYLSIVEELSNLFKFNLMMKSS